MVDWLCAPRFDSPSVFGALLDHERGQRFAVIAHAVEALVAAAVAAHRRFGHGPREVWARITLLTYGRLLAPRPAG